MIEVMVTFLIVAMGLLGMNALQSATIQNGFEAYQRALLISIVDDMAARIRMNPNNANEYLSNTGAYYGAYPPTIACSLYEGADRDKCEWNESLTGAHVSDALGAGTSAPYGARGCIERIDSNTIHVSVAWMGVSTQATALNDCAYGILPENNRRVVTREVKVK